MASHATRFDIFQGVADYQGKSDLAIPVGKVAGIPVYLDYS
jgi:hypothetical protein